MQCQSCLTDNPEQARFCLECGVKLVQVCPACGADLPQNAEFCISCGAKLAESPAEAPGVAPQAAAERLQRLVPSEYAERLLATRGPS